jgi:hypothetical protein
MSTIDRRALLGASIGGLAVLGNKAALAALQCATVNVPSRLTVDCSVARNLQLFLERENLFGLTGLVSMATFNGDLGSYVAGSMFVYPWLKSKNQGRDLAAEMRHYQAFLPGPIGANPLPNMGVPLDEQFCIYGLQAPPQDFIGFSIDVPRMAHAKLPWYSVVDGVGKRTVGVDWASDNLNGRWFGGSRAIPGGSDCNGQQWRSLIVDGLRRAATMAC